MTTPIIDLQIACENSENLPSLEQFTLWVQTALAYEAQTEDFPETEIWAEPGRYICGTAVNLITSVVGVTERGGQPWYFLDEGLYGTFSGVLFDQWDFKLISFKESEEKVAATFAGPSCDSLDIMFRGRMTAPLEVGDLLLVPSCGAYTSASATTFNGFSKARFVVWEKVQDIAGE